MGEEHLDELVITDSIALREDFDVKKLPFKFTVLSVAPLIGEAIRRIHEDRSVNSLFKEPSSH
jgi:ribose-phosphate pyrophosphokinase